MARSDPYVAVVINDKTGEAFQAIGSKAEVTKAAEAQQKLWKKSHVLIEKRPD